MNMRHEPTLTVAIPTYDREVYLREALRSIEQQTRRDVCVILFDNASPYQIENFIAEFPTLDLRILRTTTNIGNQRNFARVMAHTYATPYVMIFHDDDTIHPHYFEDALSVLDAQSDTAWIGSLIARKRMPHADMMEFAPIPTNVRTDRLSKAELADAFMDDLGLGFSTVIYRREALSRTRPDSIRFHKWLDRPFLLEACGSKLAAVMNFPYINYRLHHGQDSAQPYHDHIPEMANLIEYLTVTGSDEQRARAFAARSALQTSILNARTPRDVWSILSYFKTRGLFRFRDLRFRACYFAVRMLVKRIYCFFINR